MKTISTILVVFIVMSFATQAYAGCEVVGVFLRNEPECSVSRKGWFHPCVKGSDLIPGDIILTSRQPEAFKINWFKNKPFMSKLESNQYIVTTVFKSKKDFIGLPIAIFDFTRNTSHVLTQSVTRENDNAIQRPGKCATLLPGEVVNFCWGLESGDRFVVKDSHEKKIFERSVKGLSSLALTPEEMKLEKYISYIWVIENLKSCGGNIRFLDKESTDIVENAFETINNTKQLTANDKVIAKASFAQYISESFPEEICLNWLSYQLLEQHKNKLSKEERKIFDYLKIRFHLVSDTLF